MVDGGIIYCYPSLANHGKNLKHQRSFIHGCAGFDDRLAVGLCQWRLAWALAGLGWNLPLGLGNEKLLRSTFWVKPESLFRHWNCYSILLDCIREHFLIHWIVTIKRSIVMLCMKWILGPSFLWSIIFESLVEVSLGLQVLGMVRWSQPWLRLDMISSGWNTHNSGWLKKKGDPFDT